MPKIDTSKPVPEDQLHYIRTTTREDGLVSISVNRAFELNGQHVPAGQIIAVSPLVAAQCCATGRAAIVFADDIPIANAAAKAEDQRVTAEKRSAQKSFWSQLRE